MLGWLTNKKTKSHFVPKSKNQVQGVQSSIEPKGLIQHKFLKKDDFESKGMKTKQNNKQEIEKIQKIESDDANIDEKLEDYIRAMYKAKLVDSWAGVLKLEWNPKTKKAMVTQFPSTSSWTEGYETLFKLDDSISWNDLGVENTSEFDSENIIAETDQTVWDEFGRPATDQEIEDHGLRAENNVRVIPRADAFNELDLNFDGESDSAFSRLREYEGEYEYT